MKQERDTLFGRLLEACGSDLRRLLFLDETGASTSMVRTCGRSAQGERCVGSAPGGHWKTMTGVAAIRVDGLTAAATTAHAMDGDSFLTYLTHALLPRAGLREGLGVEVSSATVDVWCRKLGLSYKKVVRRPSSYDRT